MYILCRFVLMATQNRTSYSLNTISPHVLFLHVSKYSFKHIHTTIYHKLFNIINIFIQLHCFQSLEYNKQDEKKKNV